MTTFNPNIGLQEFTYSSQTVLPFLFKVFTEQDIELTFTYDNNGTPGHDVIDQMEYDVTLNGDEGGTIDITRIRHTYPQGSIIVIKRNLEITRDVQYHENGDLRAEVLNGDQDYQTYLIQDRALDDKYNLQVPNVPGFDGTLPPPQAGYYLQWNPSGTGIYNSVGTPGIRGPVGATGPTGSTGQAGLDGSTGSSGPQGIQGPIGPIGLQGLQGIQGAGINLMGHASEADILAKMGQSGDVWIINTGPKLGHGLVSDGTATSAQWVDVGTIQGQDGATGSTGQAGPAGSQGPTGSAGPTGANGAQGPVGPMPSTDLLAPIGSVIAFAGVIANLPQGWVVADGTNGTVDMTDRFILGSKDKVTTTGGYKDSVTVSHNHVITHTHRLGNHNHTINHDHPAVNTSTAGNHTHTNTGFGHTSGGGNGHVPGGNHWSFKSTSYTSKAAGNHHHSVNIPNFTGNSGKNNGATSGPSTGRSATAGVSGVGRNLPPFVKLYYIQRIA